MKRYTVFNKLYDTVFRAYERFDNSRYDFLPQCELPIYGVYHVFCDKDWKLMFADQINRLKSSGLLGQTKTLYVNCITKDDTDLEDLKRIADSDKLQIISNDHDPRKYEYPALQFVQKLAAQQKCLIYYFHTKGISYQSKETTDVKYERFKRNIESWRHFMEYFNFYKWKVAVNVLLCGYDTYGCYRFPPRPQKKYLYAGNFWWVNSNYVNRLPEFDATRFSTDRFFAEEWLFKGIPKNYSAFDTMADLYYVDLPEALYVDGKKSLWEGMKFVFLYNIRKFRKQILKYDYKKNYQFRYQNLKDKLS